MTYLKTHGMETYSCPLRVGSSALYLARVAGYASCVLKATVIYDLFGTNSVSWGSFWSRIIDHLSRTCHATNAEKLKRCKNIRPPTRFLAHPSAQGILFETHLIHTMHFSCGILCGGTNSADPRLMKIRSMSCCRVSCIAADSYSNVG